MILVLKLSLQRIFLGYVVLTYLYNYVQFSKNNVVGLNGLEPSTSRLSGVRSNQLSYAPMKLGITNINKNKKRVTRIELATTAWKAVVLPLNYTRIY